MHKEEICMELCWLIIENYVHMQMKIVMHIGYANFWETWL